jgi:hypothetical protein
VPFTPSLERHVTPVPFAPAPMCGCNAAQKRRAALNRDGRGGYLFFNSHRSSFGTASTADGSAKNEHNIEACCALMLLPYTSCARVAFSHTSWSRYSGTVCIIVPTYSSLLKGGQSDDEQNTGIGSNKTTYHKPKHNIRSEETRTRLSLRDRLSLRSHSVSAFHR